MDSISPEQYIEIWEINQSLHRELESVYEQLASWQVSLSHLSADRVKYRKAFELAMALLGVYTADKFSDSRAVPDEIVALATVEAGIDNEASWEIIDRVLEESKEWNL